MKTSSNIALSIAVTAATPFAIPAFSQQAMDSMKGMPMPATAAPSASTQASATAHATGVVKKVDAAAGVVTIAHEAIPAIGWPPMTMGFRVDDKKVLGRLTVGQKVDFDFSMSGKGYVVTQVN